VFCALRSIGYGQPMVARQQPIYGVIAAGLALCGCGPERDEGERSRRAVPVETAEVERARIENVRVFTGTLDAFTELAHAAKINGRVQKVSVDLGDPVAAGKVLVTLEDDEHVQAVRLAEADVTVAKAQRIEVESGLETAMRELERVEQLHGQGLMSEAALDIARAAERSAAAADARARGTLARAQAQLATARIQLGNTRIEAGPLEGGGTRVVAERHVDPGDAVSPGAPLVTTVEVDPLIAAIAVTEGDYMRIEIGQRAMLSTDALAGRSFEAEVHRIAPKFDEASRQARVELRVDNGEMLLKPGLFIRARLVLGAAEGATIIPEAALTKRGGRDGVFVVAQGSKVTFKPVEIGIRNAGRVQVIGEGVSGRVVTLGQQLLDEGTIVESQGSEPSGAPKSPSSAVHAGPPAKNDG
jgi:RND family efflux transporter MFP subunit